MPGITPAIFEDEFPQITLETRGLSADDIDLPPGLKKQFYYPLILLAALNRTPGMERRVQGGTSPLVEQDSTQIFHDFVNRVALVCQTSPGGDAVSACTVLRHPSGITYLFTSNYRSNSQLESVAAELTAILDMVSWNDGDGDDSLKLRQKILLKIFPLVKPRVKCYLNSLGKHLENCIADCERGHQEKDKILLQELRELGNLAGAARDLAGAGKDTDRLFPEATRKVVDQITSIRHSDSLFNLLVHHTLVEERRGGIPHWRETRHILDRLAAYREAVDAFFNAKGLWPALFQDFTVHFIPSSPPKTGLVSATKAQTSQTIVGKITSDEKRLARLHSQISEMQLKHDLNGQISQEWPSKDSKFLVHAEIRLHRWLETSEGGTLPERFFNGYKYIGSSKPTCKLCAYYFEEHGTDVRVRPSHRNLYLKWRMHDVFLCEIPDSQREGKMERCFPGQDENAARERMLLLRKIKVRIISDIKQILNDKLSDRRDHDSTDKNTLDMNLHRPVSTVGSLSATFDNLSVVGEVDDSPDNTTAVSFAGSLRNISHGSGSQPETELTEPDSVTRTYLAVGEIDDTPDGNRPRVSIETLRGAYSGKGRHSRAGRYASGRPSSLPSSGNVDVPEDDPPPVIIFRGRRSRGGTTTRGRGGPASRGRGRCLVPNNPNRDDID